MALNKQSEDYQVLKKTIFAECRGEPQIGQKAVAWVIKNRADLNRVYWGGNTIAGVCLELGHFECWNADRRHLIEEGIRMEPGAYAAIDAWLPTVFQGSDPSGGADHYNNPDKEGYPPWTNNCYRLQKIGNHQFYKSK
jgi:N-acetylmuramoyl-L-alanine amidase